MTLRVRKIVAYSEEVRTEGGRGDDLGALRKVVVVALAQNPLCAREWSESLNEIIEPSGELARRLAARALEVLGSEVEGYGKGAIVGLAGEQEHANACLTSVFGDAFREAIGGGTAWIPSVTKRASAGASLDIPIAFRNAIWVRSHYDAISVTVPDGPLPDELLVGLAVTNRGRINARLGGLRLEDVVGKDGLR